MPPRAPRTDGAFTLTQTTVYLPLGELRVPTVVLRAFVFVNRFQIGQSELATVTVHAPAPALGGLLRRAGCSRVRAADAGCRRVGATCL